MSEHARTCARVGSLTLAAMRADQDALTAAARASPLDR